LIQHVNEKDCWNQLCEAGRDARLLNLVPARAFVDMRNDDPQVFSDLGKLVRGRSWGRCRSLPELDPTFLANWGLFDRVHLSTQTSKLGSILLVAANEKRRNLLLIAGQNIVIRCVKPKTTTDGVDDIPPRCRLIDGRRLRASLVPEIECNRHRRLTLGYP
jgi:hypothetical protein